MKRRFLGSAGFLTVTVLMASQVPVFASGYNLIYSTTDVAHPDTTRWTVNGTLGHYGGSLISKLGIPDG